MRPATRRVLLLFVLLAVLGTWPQAIRLNAVPDNVDAYFSLWRIGWIAHQLPVDPRHLFDANIFFPERHTLAYSDAVLLEGAIALPFVRAGVPIVYVYNLFVLASFVACGMGAFLLARHLTGETLPAILAGLVFAFTPYRFDHYYHLELLWAWWMPLAFWMVHRTIAGPRLRHGLAVGLFLGLQIFSCIYYGVILSVALLVLCVTLLAGSPNKHNRLAAAVLLTGALLALVAVVPYLIQYWQVRQNLSERNTEEALLYGAGPRHYLAANPGNLLEGNLLGPVGRPEKRLFPGFVAMGLTVLALWPPVRRTHLAYLLVLAVAIDLSFGPRGIGYDWLRRYVAVFRGIRAPARFGEAALLAFAVLAAAGCQRLRDSLANRGYHPNPIVGMLVIVAAAEYAIRPIALTAVPLEPPPAYQWLRRQPPGIVAEFPFPTRETMPFHEGEFEYLSTFHWRPMVNGYSGNWTTRHIEFLEALRGFPDARSIDTLHAAGVSYVILHERYMGPSKYHSILQQLESATTLKRAETFSSDGDEVAVYEPQAPGENGVRRADAERSRQ